MLFTHLLPCLALFSAVSSYPYPSFVSNCTSGNYDGVNLIVVDCSAQLSVPSAQRPTLGQYAVVIDSNTSTLIENCLFNNCGNIHAFSPVVFKK